MLQPDGSDLPVKAIQAANLGRHPRKEESMAVQRIPGFRLGIYIFKDAEIVDFAAPYGVFSVARRFDPELDAFLIADSLRPVQTPAGFTVPPNYPSHEPPALHAFPSPGGCHTRQRIRDRRARPPAR